MKAVLIITDKNTKQQNTVKQEVKIGIVYACRSQLALYVSSVKTA